MPEAQSSAAGGSGSFASDSASRCVPSTRLRRMRSLRAAVHRPAPTFSPARWMTASRRPLVSAAAPTAGAGQAFGVDDPVARRPLHLVVRFRRAADQANHLVAAGREERDERAADQAVRAGDRDAEPRPARVARVLDEIAAERVVPVAEQARKARVERGGGQQLAGRAERRRVLDAVFEDRGRGRRRAASGGCGPSARTARQSVHP